MCGIFFSLGINGYVAPDKELVKLLKLRGPDSYKEHKVCLNSGRGEGQGDKDAASSRKIYLTFVSSVLSLRGDSIRVQPLTDSSTGSVLCWNGEAWKFDDRAVPGNDTQFVFDQLLGQPESVDAIEEKSSKVSELLGIVQRISGPFSFVFFDATSRNILFGRDVLGRRSLLHRRYEDGSFAISSVSSGKSTSSWQEIEADGLYVLEFPPDHDNQDRQRSFPWLPASLLEEGGRALRSSLPGLNRQTYETEPTSLSLVSKSVDDLETQLRQSLKLRLQEIPQPPLFSPVRSDPGDCRLAILFSGGVDCTLLTRLAHDILPREQTIDLLNVVFENPRIAATSNGASINTLYEQCPDRMTGRSSFGELQKVCSSRKFRFVCINIPYHEVIQHRQNIVSLMFPHNTEMDLSIALALYFAARGQGFVFDHKSQKLVLYSTPARVLLSGLGADELFGGYTRHATAFKRRSYVGLIDELELDVGRLGKRNLGRDDRVISHWGKEVRYPFLDENLLNWALELPVWEKCGFRSGKESEGAGEPDLEPGKRIVRLLAWRLGMKIAAMEKKRAIQFGARTAKMEEGKRKGTDSLT